MEMIGRSSSATVTVTLLGLSGAMVYSPVYSAPSSRVKVTEPSGSSTPSSRVITCSTESSTPAETMRSQTPSAADTSKP